MTEKDKSCRFLKPGSTCTIIGLGLMGGSLVKAIRQICADVQIIGVDFSEVLKHAEPFLDRAYQPAELKLAVQHADLVFIAAPTLQIKKILPELVPLIKNGALVTDLGSTKAEIVTTAGKLFSNLHYFIGGHPMTGREKGGWFNADPYLFENAIYVLTRPLLAPSELVDELVYFLRQLGAQVMFLDADEHDAIAADVSHLPQLLAIALTNFITRHTDSSEAKLRLAAGGFRDMTRIAMSPFSVWKEIFSTNLLNVLTSLDQFIETLQTVREQLAEDKLQKTFEQANHLRLRIPRDSRGFLYPNFDITVTAPDIPGVIAKMASALADEKINIKDIEVLKIREGSGATLRLAFTSETIQASAIEILQAKGFTCSRRE